MNSWWLNLYTLPHFKRHLQIIGAVTLTNILISFFSPDFGWAFFMYMYPLFNFASSKDDTLIANLDFHKLSVPYPELIRAVFLDAFLEFITFIFMLFLGLYLPLAIYDQEKNFYAGIADIFLGTPSYTILSLVGFTTLIFSIKFSKQVKKTIQEFQKASQTNSKLSRKAFIGIMLFSCIGAAYGKSFIDGVLDSFEMNILLMIASVFIFFSCFSLTMFFRTKFHLEKSLLSGKRASYVLSTVGGSVAVFILILGSLSRFEMNNNFFSASSRVKTLHFFDDFAPELEVDTVADMLMASQASADFVWKHASKECWQLPINQIFDSPDYLFVWYQYLSYGKPSDQNLVYMLRKIEENHKSYDPRLRVTYRGLRQKLISYLPEASKLPPDLQKMDAVKRRPASPSKKISKEKNGP